ncbi:MAG: YdjY domain-containing protein [Planctomycetaceae bacterium]
MTVFSVAVRRCWPALLWVALGGSAMRGDDSGRATAPAAGASTGQAAEPVPLNPQKTVLLDRAGGRLILKTKVVLRQGLLEMLLCKSQTKEHESILAIDSDAYVIHAGLLAIGAEVGTPVQYQPEFKPPTGQEIEVRLRWKDAEGREQTASGQQWIRTATHRYYAAPLDALPPGFAIPKDSELRYDELNKELLWFGKMSEEQRDELLKLSENAQYQAAIRKFHEQSQARQMDAKWVFAGSGFYIDDKGEKYYQAEGGNVVCVANFGDALLDVGVASSDSNDGLNFEPFTERIPPLETVVEVDLIPVKAKQPGAAEPAEAGSPKPRGAAAPQPVKPDADAAATGDKPAN